MMKNNSNYMRYVIKNIIMKPAGILSMYVHMAMYRMFVCM